jgi:excisionase family DNA binding protein
MSASSSTHGPIFDSAESAPRRVRRAKSEADTPRYVTLERAAAYIDTTPRTIRRAIAEGRLTGYRFGKRMLRVDLVEVEAALRPVPAVAS